MGRTCARRLRNWTVGLVAADGAIEILSMLPVLATLGLIAKARAGEPVAAAIASE